MFLPLLAVLKFSCLGSDVTFNDAVMRTLEPFRTNGFNELDDRKKIAFVNILACYIQFFKLGGVSAEAQTFFMHAHTLAARNKFPFAVKRVVTLVSLAFYLAAVGVFDHHAFSGFIDSPFSVVSRGRYLTGIPNDQTKETLIQTALKFSLFLREKSLDEYPQDPLLGGLLVDINLVNSDSYQMINRYAFDLLEYELGKLTDP